MNVRKGSDCVRIVSAVIEKNDEIVQIGSSQIHYISNFFVNRKKTNKQINKRLDT